jgi:hypothetical protein
LITNDLNVGGVLTYESLLFDTIVVRRVSDNNFLSFRELQVWVNDENILPDSILVSINVAGNDLGETPEFFNNSTTKTETANSDARIASNIANDSISQGVAYYPDTASLASSGTDSNASLYIPLTTQINIYNIQSFILYNTTNTLHTDNVIGLKIELYNRANDSTLSTPLLSTNTISSGKNVYRFDFPAIDTYSLSFVGSDSTSNIVNDTYATKEVVSITSNPVEINTDLTISGDLVVGGDLTITGSIVNTSLSSNLSSIQTQVNALINFTGGGVNFRVYSLSDSTISVGNNLIYDNESYDTEDSYDTATGVYTIVIGGTYLFTCSWVSISNITAVVNLIRSRGGVQTIIQQGTNGTSSSNSFYVITTIDECETGDLIYANVESGSVKLTIYGTTEPTNQTSFSGSRISN